MGYRDATKRALDLAVAAPFLVFASPLLLLLLLCVCWRLGFPAIFRQQRSGLGGKPFTLFKLRTMTEARDEHGEPLSDEARLTRFGRFLRATSLDELPELWNVIRGEMSLVGPRPLLTEYVDRYSPRQARRLEVKPGITGWAQINGRNALDWQERFELDVWYVDHQNIWLDLLILLRTIPNVLSRRGISAECCATMTKFQGSRCESPAHTAAMPAARTPETDGVLVVGAGGHAKVVVATLRAAGFRVGGIYDDNPSLHGTQILGAPVVGPLKDLKSCAGAAAVIAVGDCRVRSELSGELPLEWVTVVHPAAWVHESVSLGAGTVVFAQAAVQPASRLGCHVIVNTAATVDHDCTVEDFVHIAPGVHLAGNVTVAEGALLGIGAVAAPGTAIGAWSCVGAGGVVTRNIPAKMVAVGCPARAYKPIDGLRRAS